MKNYTKTKKSIYMHTVGSLGQLEFLSQSLRPQATCPWPSKVPPPLTVNWSIYRKLIQLSVENLDGSAGALRSPPITTPTEPLHGPSNLTEFTMYDPGGIKTLPFPFHSHASFHALRNA